MTVAEPVAAAVPFYKREIGFRRHKPSADAVEAALVVDAFGDDDPNDQADLDDRTEIAARADASDPVESEPEIVAAWEIPTVEHVAESHEAENETVAVAAVEPEAQSVGDRGAGGGTLRQGARSGCDVAILYHNSHEEAEAVCQAIRDMDHRPLLAKINPATGRLHCKQDSITTWSSRAISPPTSNTTRTASSPSCWPTRRGAVISTPSAATSRRRGPPACRCRASSCRPTSCRR